MTKRLSAGDVVPFTEAVDTDGSSVSLAKNGTKYTLLAFLRYAGCPYCNLSVHRLAMENELLRQSGCGIMAFIQSTPESIKKNIYGRHAVTPKFPIIPDQKMNYYKQYGVSPSLKTSAKIIRDIPQWVHAVRHHGFKQGKVDGSLFMAPAIFLVHNNSGKIIVADYDSNLFNHETFSPLYDAIAEYDIHSEHHT